ncbi:hypothetical protein RRSWK_07149 [Rhodopirellula sp. SWK7]|nr:hypothetical protein RRSWK_07149 [Rhodopirellula sp. SWK7]
MRGGRRSKRQKIIEARARQVRATMASSKYALIDTGESSLQMKRKGKTKKRVRHL